jgi:hypothetical protein
MTILTEEQENWLLSLDISLSFFLGLGTFANLVRLKYSLKHKFNDLSLVPYYVVIGYSAASLVQFSMTVNYETKSISYWNTLLIINVIKFNLGYTIFATAIYEWFCILSMINF